VQRDSSSIKYIKDPCQAVKDLLFVQQIMNE